MVMFLAFLFPSLGMYPVEQFVVFVRCPCQFLDTNMPFIILFGFFVEKIAQCFSLTVDSLNASNYDNLIYFLFSNNL